MLVCLCTWVTYIANNMDPDKTVHLGTAPSEAVRSGFILFACLKKSSLKGYKPIGSRRQWRTCPRHFIEYTLLMGA